jgi:hypothetical protein
MSDPASPIADPEDLLGTYAFLPWLRQGMANAITAPPASGNRASIHVEVDVTGTPVTGGAPLMQPASQDIALYGPGDILGIDPRAVIRVEPRAGVSNFESNYLAAIDFYDEDFPWRYTPAPPAGLQLSPWIALIVFKQGEYAEGKNIANRPLPFITLTDTTVLPNASELWAWAHVHFNQGLSPSPSTELVSTDMGAVVPRVQSILDTNPDLAYSRLLCPRMLDVNTTYDAFVIPVFESGRLAGLGHDPTKGPSALASAWAPYANQQEPLNFPYYYRWQFTTGDRGDFRYLVTLLQPQPVDATVGTRDFDVLDPGSNLPGIDTAGLNGVLRLGGALEVPDADLSDADKATRAMYENWDQPYPDPFEVALAKFINLADDYSTQTPAAANAASGITPSTAGISQPIVPHIANDPDPLITSPLYGRWHALTQRVVLFNSDGTTAPNSTNWLHRLNLDPRFRTPANYGAEVVEANAEEYMNYAWQQIGDVLAANQNIRRLHFATAAASRLYARHLVTAASDPARMLTMTAPVASRVLYSGVTVASLRASAAAPTLVPPVLTSTVFRRVVRPGGRLMRTLPFTATATRTNLIQRINAGEVTSAPTKTVPAGVVTVDQAVNAPIPTGAQGAILNWLKKYPWLPWVVLGIAILLAIMLFLVLGPLAGGVAALAVIAVGVYVFRLLRRAAAQEQAPQTVSQAGQTTASVASYPTSSNFVLSTPGSSFVPQLGGADSPTGVRFNTALTQSFQLNAASNSVGQHPAPVAINLASISNTVVTAIDPKTTILRRGLSMIALPPWIISQIGDDFNEVMAYPKIDLPMYQPLEERSDERLLPNINKIARNSITLMETNQRFIEAYMVGLNYEFARKLLWREYPTDQRGSYFRQFWSVGDTIDSEGLSEDALKEKLYDIPEIHRWAATSSLGEHNNRIPAGQPAQPQAVLIIRGELLKKYPNTVIFAQHAKMTGNLREPDWLTPDEEQNPPPSKTRTPLYQAHPTDDIFFFGFDLTIDQVKGTGGDPGWYFVLQERPGEARFGLEVSPDPPIETFDDVAWNDAMPGIKPGQFLGAGALSSVGLTEPSNTTDPPKHDQWNDDRRVSPAGVSSARWAYMLLRQPVMVAIHASEMLAQNRS